jgi:hypothetical protein
MRVVNHREKPRPRLSTTLGWLSGAALAALPVVAYGWDTDLDAPPAPAVSDSTPPPVAPDWEQISSNSEIAASDGPVLELPPVAPSSDTASADTASASSNDNAEPAEATASVDDEGPGAADNRASDLSDDEEREAVPSALPLWPPPVTVVTMPRSYLGVNYNAMPRPGVIVVSPGLNPIPATSPMLSAPRSTSFAGGWWNRAR